MTSRLQKTPSFLLISGSARASGNTAMIVRRLLALLGGQAQAIDLNDHHIDLFRYGAEHDRDDFGVLARKMAGRHTIFLTPVYWYAMSGVMKVFFDRFTDLLGQAEGRKLSGSRLSCIATGADDHPPKGFELPFALTAGYFNMSWQGLTYIKSAHGDPPSEEALKSLDDLCAKLLAMVGIAD